MKSDHRRRENPPVTQQQTDDQPVGRRSRRGRGPGRSLEERVTAAEARLLRLRQNAETQLLRAAEKAHLFEYMFTAPQLQQLLTEMVGQEQRPLSLLRRKKMELEQLKARKTKSARKDMGRTKALLGSFMVAQWRHKPALHAELAPDLRDHLGAHKRPEMAQANIEFMAGLLADPGWEETVETNPDAFAMGISDQQLRRNRSRRMILIGAWVLDRRNDLAAIDTLVRNELAQFLEQDSAPERNIALLRDALGPF